LAFVTISMAALTAAAQQPDEYLLKAALLFNFGKFVEWPADLDVGDS
jgi:hypothetical protein